MATKKKQKPATKTQTKTSPKTPAKKTRREGGGSSPPPPAKKPATKKKTATKTATSTKAAKPTTTMKPFDPNKVWTHHERKAALTSADPRLGKWIAPLEFTLEPNGLTSVYEALARSIVYQQLTGKAAATIYGRLEKLGKNGLPTPEEIATIDDTALRGVGLSGSKAKALRDLADRSAKGLLPTAEEAAGLDDDTLIEQLSAVRGIGPWSVHMLLIFRLGRPDVLPITDYGVLKGWQKVMEKKELPKPKELLAWGERWRPHRSMAAWFLWRVLDSNGGQG